MITYGDYFSRKLLHNCGVSPSAKLFANENSYVGSKRTDVLRTDMNQIYQTLYGGFVQKNTGAKVEDISNLNLERKIVSAFYDSGILNNAEREYFYTQSFNNINEREQIFVQEATTQTYAGISQKVDAPTIEPLIKNL